MDLSDVFAVALFVLAPVTVGQYWLVYYIAVLIWAAVRFNEHIDG